MRPTAFAIPEAPLFHGTDAGVWSVIQTYGLLPQNRFFVQLTTDFEYAEEIAKAQNVPPESALQRQVKAI